MLLKNNKKTETLIQKDILTPMFTKALFTKIWMYPKCPLTDEEIMDTQTHTHSGILFNHKKE